MSAQNKSTALKDIRVMPAEDFNCKDARTTSVKGFRLLKNIESGGFGTVFLGEHENEDQMCAIKVVNKWTLSTPALQDSIKMELKIHKELNHQYIVKMLAAFQTPTRVCFVLELASQLSMADLPGKLPKKDIKHWLAEIVEGLCFLHGKSIMHRDIKRENILLESAGHVKIADFGFAKDGMEKETKAYEAVGTAFSMSPEMYKDSGYTRSADIWAFGILAFELISNESLYDTTDPTKIRGILRKMKSCDKLEFPRTLTKKELDFVKGMLQFEEKRMSLEEVRNHIFFSGVEWNALLEHNFKGAPYQLPAKEDSKEPIILKDQKKIVPLSFEDFEFSNF